MWIIIIFLLISLVLGGLYTHIIKKFTKSKVILFIPTIMGVLWHLYTATLYITKDPKGWGFGDLEIIVISMAVLALMVGNIFSSLLIILNKKDNHKS